VRPFSVPVLSLVKALSLGAKKVRPSYEFLSWLVSCSEIRVACRSRSSVEYCPPLSRMLVRLSSPGGDGPGAGATTSSAAAAKRKGRRRRRGRAV